jgi:multicomponent Na+:H+ antiporter subunit B
MGEEYILFGSVLGTLVLLRQLREEQESEGDDQAGVKEISEPSDAVRLLGLVLLVLLIMFGIYIILHAHMTPGGGFQGGAIVGTAMLLVYLTGGYNVYSGISPPNLMEFLHAGAAGSYVAIGLSGLIVGGVFLSNILPLGTSGHFASGGTIPLINDAVGLEVSNGFAIIFHEFITQTRRRPT